MPGIYLDGVIDIAQHEFLMSVRCYISLAITSLNQYQVADSAFTDGIDAADCTVA